MKKRLFIALVIILVLIPTSVALANKPLKFDTTYKLSLIAGPPPDPAFACDGGRGLAWVGTVEGASFNGNIYYCMHFADPANPADQWNRPTGIVNHWEDAVFEIWVGGEPVLRGEGGGSTTLLPLGAEKTANWRGMGVITEVGEGFEEWDDRPYHDGGYVIGDFPVWSGEGKLFIH